jgi:hypothetical protein
VTFVLVAGVLAGRRVWYVRQEPRNKLAGIDLVIGLVVLVLVDNLDAAVPGVRAKPVDARLLCRVGMQRRRGIRRRARRADYYDSARLGFWRAPLRRSGSAARLAGIAHTPLPKG